MDILNQIISGLNKEEVRFFKMYLSRIETDDNRKDIQLFDYIRKSGNRFDDEWIFKKLYQQKDKNSFYRLKNRLMREVNKSLTLQHFDDDNIVYIFRLLALVKFYLNKNSLKPAYYFLKKAESKAAAIENLELLDIIYSEFIRISREMVSINPETYIAKRKENTERLQQLRTIDDVLAAVAYRLKVTQNLSASESPVITLLQKTIDDFTNDQSLSKSPLFRFKIYHAVSQLLIQSHQYIILEDYLLKTYKLFVHEKLFNKNNHETKLQMLVFIINCLYKNNKIKKSLEFSDTLLTSMKEYNQLLFDKYLFYYYNALVINYSKIDKHKEIEVLKEMEKNEKIKSNSFYQHFILLNMALAYFDIKQFSQAAKFFTKLQLMEDYKESDSSLRLKISIAELMTRYELNDYNTFEYKLKQHLKDFRKLLQEKDHLSERLMSDILKIMITNHSAKKRFLETKVKQLHQISHADEHSGLIDYKEWLNEKIKGNKIK